MTTNQPSHVTRDRVLTAVAYANGRADWLDSQAVDCADPVTCQFIAAWAHDLRRIGRIVLGDIGREEEQEEWDIEPMTTPAPVEVPTPSAPVPA